MRRFGAWFVAGLSMISLAGCGGGSGDPVFFEASAPPVVADTASAAASPALPSSPSPSLEATASPSASASASAAATTKLDFYFPVVGNNSYAHTHHDYPASDIITNCGNKVRAVVSGTVLAVSKKDTWKASVNDGATRGGLSISILGDDGARYYGSHLSFIAAKIKVGARVTGGETIAKVGDTGDASACHLHFGISPPCAETGDWWNQRGTIWPWRYLDAWKAGKDKSAAAATKAWQEKNGCPKAPTTE
ncbi:M23 family metallopeptidase [Actinoplanes sp. NPDC051851]|uniref:M23 family metallopeptidase n=1 Tax=Actinoplanes sp. NPDC051851 TaxID=3154753 RepID=UPI0034139582